MDRSAKHVVMSYAEQRAGTAASSSIGITCPRCGGQTMVTDTRKLFGVIRRYRQCVMPQCRMRLTPTEEKQQTPLDAQ